MTESRCIVCRQTFSHRADRRRTYCSNACHASKERGLLKPELPLAVFLFDRWGDSGLSLMAYAQTLRIHKRTLTKLISNRLPSRKTYDRLKRAFGAPLPPSATETEAQKLERARVHDRQPKLGSKKSREMYRKIAKTLRRPRPPEHAARAAGAARASGALAQGKTRLIADARSTEGRIRRMLFGRLRHVSRPSRPQIRGWARDAADGANRSAADVLAVWTPYLEARGLWSKRGRKANEDRHQLIDELIAAAARTAKGRLPRGFWERAAAEISEREGEHISGPELFVWYDRHCRGYCRGRDNIA